jgi:AcrR family transcriptional regulator
LNGKWNDLRRTTREGLTRDDKKDKRRNAIAKAGAELFSKKGFLDTSMEEISAAAKLSKGGIYHYFSSKTDLLYFIIDNFMEIVLKNLEEELDEADDGLEKVKKLIFRHVEIYPKHMAEAKTLFFEAKNLPPRPFKSIVSKEREYYRIAAKALTGYFGSSLEEDQVKALTFILLSMCNSIYAWYNPKGTIKPDDLSRTVFEILTGGVAGFRKEGSGIPHLQHLQDNKVL